MWLGNLRRNANKDAIWTALQNQDGFRWQGIVSVIVRTPRDPNETRDSFGFVEFEHVEQAVYEFKINNYIREFEISRLLH